MNRRQFVGIAAGTLAAGLLKSAPLALAAAQRKITCLAFDAFAIFDPRPIGVLTEQLFPNRGTELLNAWRTRQFEYTWLRSIADQYAGFWKVTDDALVFAARMLKLELTDAKRQQLMNAFLHLNGHADAKPALTALKNAGLRLAFLSNFTPTMLEAGIKNSDLAGMFEHVLSTDAVKVFKPAPAAYQMAIDAFHVPRQQILFVPFAGWDAAGAKWFGYETFWVNRQGLPIEELDETPDATGQSLTDLVKYLKV